MNEIFEKLEKKGLVFAGSLIPVDELEEVFGIKKDDKNFVWKKLALRARIELECFFVTERDCEEDGSIKILNANEMAVFGENKLKKNKQSNEKVAFILKGTDTSKLTEEEKVKHNVAQRQAANCASAMEVELLRKNVL